MSLKGTSMSTLTSSMLASPAIEMPHRYGAKEISQPESSADGVASPARATPGPSSSASSAAVWKAHRTCYFFWKGRPVSEGLTSVPLALLNSAISSLVTRADSGSTPPRLNSVHW